MVVDLSADADAEARRLLARLGALDATGQLTAHGRAMAALGVHPRLAHLVLRGTALGMGALACDLAALLEERDLLRRDGGPGRPPADLTLRLDALHGRDAGHRMALGLRADAERAFGDRAAINAPLQGASADIIRRAMVRMPEALASAGLKTRMLLQVHDELVFEAPEAEAAAAGDVIRRIMAGAAEPAVALSVPLKVEVNAAANWDDAH